MLLFNDVVVLFLLPLFSARFSQLLSVSEFCSARGIPNVGQVSVSGMRLISCFDALTEMHSVFSCVLQ